MAVKISPCLVLGIGSSGLEIINSVRELLYEELGYAGLPLVRFIHISSHTGGEQFTSLPNEQFGNDWEKIKVIDASIGRDKYRQIPHKLDPEHHLYDKKLAEWLNPRVASIPNTFFDAGAGNIRQAGRLCLWTNWDKISSGINAIIGQMSRTEAFADTDRILKEYVRRKRQNVERDESLADDSQEPRVFVTGSLVGGTGSGMTIDLAYFFQEYHPKFTRYGIFTVMDSEVGSRQSSTARAANNYASVIELDYFSQLGTTYDYILPSTMKALNSNDTPYKYISLLSTKNRDGSIATIVNNEGEADLGSLHKMIGISIFFDVFGGGTSTKEGIKADYARIVGTFPKVKTEPHYLKCFSSFGATALWFPKSRISGAVAAKKIDGLIDIWVGGDNPNKGKIQHTAELLKERLLNGLRSRMSQFIDENGERISLNTHWARDLDAIENQLLSTETDVQQLVYSLQSTPEDNPLADRFRRNGYYYRKIKDNLADGRDMVSDILAEELNNIIRSVFSRYTETAEVLTFNDVVILAGEIEQIVDEFADEEIEIEDTPLDYGELDIYLDAVAVEEKRTLTWLVGVREKVVEQHHNRIAHKLREILEFESKSLLDHFVVQVFGDARNDIKKRLFDLYRPYREMLEEVKGRAATTYKELSQPTSTASLKLVSREGGGLDSEIKNMTEKIDSDRVKTLVDPLNVYALFQSEGADSRKIFGQLMGVLQREVLNKSEFTDFNIVDSVMRRDIQTAISFAKNAAPMIEGATDYKPVALPDEPTLLAGGKRNSRDKLRKRLANENVHFAREMDIDLDHLIYFYREESVIGISEMAAFHVWEEQYLNMSENDEFGSHIDKNPNRFDIATHHYIEEIKSGNWIKISLDLFEKDIFKPYSENEEDQDLLVFHYQDEFDRDAQLYLNIDKPEEFVERLANRKLALDEYRKKFNKLFLVLGKEGIKARVKTYLDGLQSNGHRPDKAFFQNEERFYLEKIKEKFQDRKNG